MSPPTVFMDDHPDPALIIATYRGYLLSVASALRGGAHGDFAAPSDIVQETMAAAMFKARAGRMPVGDADRRKLWLRKILVRLHINNRRKERATKRGGLLRVAMPAESPPTDPGTSPSGEAFKNEMGRLIATAFVGPWESDKTLIRWRYRESETCEEIGRRLGCSAVYASRISRRALERLRSALPSNLDGGSR